MAEDRVQIAIEAVDRASKELRNVKDGLGGVDDASTSAASGVGKFALAGAAVAAGLAVVNAAMKAFTFVLRESVDLMKEAVSLAGIQEKAEIQLATSLRAVGAGGLEAFRRMKQFAGELQNLTGIGDEVTIAGMSMLASVGRLSGEGLERATTAAVAMSLAMGQDLSSSMRLMAQAASGNVSALSRYIGKIDSSVSKSEQFEIALRRIEGSMVPLIETIGGSFSVQTDKVSAAWGDLLEKFGDAIIKNPLVKRGMDATVDALIQFQNIVASTNFQKAFNVLLEGLINAAQFALKTARGVVLLAEAVLRFGGRVSFTANVLSTMRGKLFMLSGDLELLKLDLVTVGDVAKDTAEAIAQIPLTDEEKFNLLRQQLEGLEIAGRSLQDSLPTNEDESGIFNLEEVAESIADSTEEMRSFRDEVGLTNEGIADIGTGMALAFTDGLESAREFFDSVMRRLAAAILRALILKAIMSSIGGGGAASPTSPGGGGFSGIGPVAFGDKIPFSPTPLGEGAGVSLVAAASELGGGGANINNQFMGTSPTFVREVGKALTRLSRTHNVRLASSTVR